MVMFLFIAFFVLAFLFKAYLRMEQVETGRGTGTLLLIIAFILAIIKGLVS